MRRFVYYVAFMRALSLGLFVSLVAVSSHAAEGPPLLSPPQGWQPKAVSEYRYDVLAVDFWSKAAKKAEKHEVKGRRWTGAYEAPKGTKLEAPEKDAIERLKAQGWTLDIPSGAIIAHRTVGNHEAWLKMIPWPDRWTFDLVEEGTTPRVPKLVAPTAAIENVGADQDFPYLGHFEGQKLERSHTEDGVFTIPHPGGKPESVYGPIQHKVHRGTEEVSPFECMMGYREALSAKGWVLDSEAPHSSNMSNGIVAAHYAKDGRDLHVSILCNRHSTGYDALDGAAAAQASKLKKELDEKGKIALYGIYFDLDSDALKPESEGTLKQILDLLKADPKLKLEIDGHTDDSGSSDHNKPLSEKRAAAVRKWLVDHQIDGTRLTTAGFGETKPVGDNKTAEGRAKNRRVELVKK